MAKRLLIGAVAVLALVCGVVALAPSVMAAGRYSSGDTNYIKADEIIDGSAYLAGSAVRVEGRVNGDVYCVGKDIVIDGTVNGDVLCAGASVMVNGKVSGDVRVVGQSITLGGQVAGNVAAFGSVTTVESAAKIGRDAVLGGGDVLMNGTVGRDFVATAQKATVNGPVLHDVEGSYGELTIGKGAVIGGFLHYTSDIDAVVNGAVSGDTQRTAATKASRFTSQLEGGLLLVTMAGLWAITISVILQLVLPKKMHTVTSLTTRDAVLAAALGLVALITVPMFASFLITSVVALPLGIALILAWLTLCAISVGVTAIYLGRVVFKKQKIHPIGATALAALGLGIMVIIPIINVLVVIGTLAFGAGAVLYSLRHEYKNGAADRPKAKLIKSA